MLKGKTHKEKSLLIKKYKMGKPPKGNSSNIKKLS